MSMCFLAICVFINSMEIWLYDIENNEYMFIYIDHVCSVSHIYIFTYIYIYL